LAIEVDGRIRSGRVIEVLSRLISERGARLFVARALLKWMADHTNRNRADRSRQALVPAFLGT
jgi:hypothetical protein